jgi:hypothetical protein
MLDNIKKLISQGDTQEAIDALQDLLKERNSKLLNQTYLLESQFKELQSKIRLGIQSEATELNRINMSLLSICDDIKEEKGKSIHHVAASENPSFFQNPNVKWALIGAGALLALLLLINILSGGGEENAQNEIPAEQHSEQPVEGNQTEQSADNNADQPIDEQTDEQPTQQQH